MGCYRLPPYTSCARVSNASTILSATFGRTAWLAMRCSGLAKAKVRSMVRRVDGETWPPGAAGANDQVVTRFLKRGVRLDAVAWGQSLRAG